MSAPAGGMGPLMVMGRGFAGSRASLGCLITRIRGVLLLGMIRRDSFFLSLSLSVFFGWLLGSGGLGCFDGVGVLGVALGGFV